MEVGWGIVEGFTLNRVGINEKLGKDLHFKMNSFFYLCLTVSATFSGSINFLIADGLKFSHPLHHLGKGPEVIANTFSRFTFYATKLHKNTKHCLTPLFEIVDDSDAVIMLYKVVLSLTLWMKS